MIDEGYIKFDVDWTAGPALDLPEVDALNRWRAPLYAAGLIGHDETPGVGFGNLSARVGAGNQFVISGTQTGHIAATGREHYTLVTDCDVARNRVACCGPTKASSETMTHAAIYALDPTTTAIVHGHDMALWARVLDVIPTTDAGVAYGTPGMAREFGRLLEETAFRTIGVAAMAGHEAGLIAIGATVEQAANRILALRERADKEQAVRP